MLHGKKAIVLARFVPVVRTFARYFRNRAHGLSHICYLQCIGGIFWCLLLIGAGYILGNILPNSGEVLTLVIFAIIVVSLIPVANEAYGEWKAADQSYQKVGRMKTI